MNLQDQIFVMLRERRVMMSARGIAEQFGLRPSQVIEVMPELEQRGWVQRHGSRHPNDKIRWSARR